MVFDIHLSIHDSSSLLRHSKRPNLSFHISYCTSLKIYKTFQTNIFQTFKRPNHQIQLRGVSGELVKGVLFDGGGVNYAKATNQSSPRLEGTRMKLSHKQSKGDTRSSPFDKEPESPRKRLSPKTLATIKGATQENPIKMDTSSPKLMSKKK